MSDNKVVSEQGESSPAPENAETPAAPSRWNVALNEMLSGSIIISILSIVLALVVGAILIVIVDPKVAASAGYFFARPLDTLGAMWDSAAGAYSSLFQGSIYNFRRPDFAGGIRPFTETLNFAAPLIVAGLGVALAFRVGLFNIGGRGQMLIAAACAGYVGFTYDMPPVVHLVVAIVAGLIGGALWGGIVGLLKARTGAHEVIVTIMLNYVAFYLVSYMLRTQGLLQEPGSNNPKTAAILPNAVMPDLIGSGYNLNISLIMVIALTVVVWWILSRSSLGFQFRAVGENPNAARVAGIRVDRMYIYAMLISGGLVGMAGVIQVLGTVPSGFSSGIDAGIGFDAITVALLGRAKPWGVFFAGLLFGAFKAGGFAMQAAEGIPIDIVLVVQSLIVLFIAAPPLVRALFRLPTPVGEHKPIPLRKPKLKAVVR
jgi:ABC-type uncharacterized transport system permease subunit